MLESGFKISDLKNIPVHKHDCPFKNKITLDNTFLLSYSHTVYGINYNRQNYKIPLNYIRDDIRGYIGIESLVRPWSEQIKLWQGSWISTNKNKSYVYVWQESERNDPDYTPEKFNDLENSYFIIKDCPFPYETGELNNREKGEKLASELSEGIAYTNNSINVPIKAADPYPDSNKLVTKSYIDERLASKRVVEVGTDFYVRDYDCTYIIRSSEIIDKKFNNIFKIRLPDSFNKRVLHNKIEFSLLVEGIWNAEKEIWMPATTSDVAWEFYNAEGELIDVVWVNNEKNKPVEISKEILYINAQYLIFRFETATDSVDATPIIDTIDGQTLVTAYNTTANYKIFITCENYLYRRSGIEKVNDIEGTSLNIGSADNSIKVTAISDGNDINVDLSIEIESENNFIIVEEKEEGVWNLEFNGNLVAQKHFIEELPESIDIMTAANKVFWTNKFEPTIRVNNHYNLKNEVVSFDLLLITDTDTVIKTVQSNIVWGNVLGDQHPLFKANRVYHITFTNYYCDTASPFLDIVQTAKINWFAPKNKINWYFPTN